MKVLQGAAWLLILPGQALAHPVDEIVQGAYLTVAPGVILLELDLTPGTEVAGTLLREVDANADQRISEVESHAYAERVLKQSTLTLDGVRALWRVAKVSVPPYLGLKLAGDTLKIYAIAARADSAGAHTLHYDNRYQPAKSQCIGNVFLQPGAGWNYQVTGQQHGDDGRQLTVRYTARA